VRPISILQHLLTTDCVWPCVAWCCVAAHAHATPILLTAPTHEHMDAACMSPCPATCAPRNMTSDTHTHPRAGHGIASRSARPAMPITNTLHTHPTHRGGHAPRPTTCKRREDDVARGARLTATCPPSSPGRHRVDARPFGPAAARQGLTRELTHEGIIAKRAAGNLAAAAGSHRLASEAAGSTTVY